MNLYHISQTACNGYDTFSDAVVAAPTEEIARTIHPRVEADWDHNTKTFVYPKVQYLQGPTDDSLDASWWNESWPVDPKYVTATLIGTAVEGTPESVICASFRAG